MTQNEQLRTLRAFEAACEKVEKQYGKHDDNARFHDIGALRGYLSLFLEAYLAATEKWETPEGKPIFGQGSPHDVGEYLKRIAAEPELSDVSTYEFDTSKYLKIKSTVTRDKKTGSFAIKPEGEKP